MSTSIIVDPDEQQTQDQDAPDQEEDKQPDAPYPEKFKGKSLDDVIGMYSSLESEYGRRSNEIGQLRRLTDQLLGLEQAKRDSGTVKSPPKKITGDDLFNDPDTAISERVKALAEERASATDARVSNLEQSLAEAAFERRHGGFRSTMETPEFLDFVKGSNYRRNLVVKAAQNDWDAADELFGLFEERQALTASAAPAKDEQLGEARKAGLVKSGGSSASGAVKRQTGKKIYSRAELIDLRINRPEEFDRRYQEEFMPAYAEGRVK